MEHYFTRKPTSSEKEKIIEDTLKGRKLKFRTSSGVFSKDKIDFGTRILVETVDVSLEDVVLDAGCGYGVIGITLSFFCGVAVLIDINERACQLAQENIVLNKVSNAFTVCGTVSCLLPRFDVIAMNPPIRAGKKVVFSLLEESRNLLQGTGKLYVVARTRQGAKSIYAFMSNIFPHTEYAALKGGYRVIKGTH
ncbi:MAG: class I SAM-dependent methyltransferase [Theionarchaea archaeon]|nr:class I SAM-dependent methyltransferase [Theionarchaea archaeon]